ncbi:MAG: hypothetical protein DRJ08_02475 [Acidobacteria bacterium]|nr:MAG: hypothetical protein DRJ14_01035 [Acidobacteriota bacterium]RLE23496.1 MAG: hypothetical protein DRJ08_02475 [Acidobacteriota bacterium]
MQVEITITQDYVQYNVSGKLDSISAPEFEENVISRMEEHSADTIFHLEGLNYISSSGLRIFLQAAKIARMNSTRVILSAVQPQVREIFDLAGFTQFFTFADDLDTAISILKGNTEQ